jgi:thioredoxin 1
VKGILFIPVSIQKNMRNKMIFAGLLLVAVLFAFAFIPGKREAGKETGIVSVNGLGIQFIEDNWNKALDQAKKENKLIFLDAYASWCGPCKLLKRKTFPDKQAGEFFNKNFINVAVDMEKGEGPALGAKYRVTAYPTLIITDADGNIVTYTQGYMSAKQLIEFGKHGLKQKK